MRNWQFEIPSLTDSVTINRVSQFQERDLYDPRTQWASFVINALKAKELQSRDVNYIVRGEEVRTHITYSLNIETR